MIERKYPLRAIDKAAQFITRLFPLWVILFSVYALIHPALFQPYRGAVPSLLGLVMLGMGLTLTPVDFRLILTRPRDVFYGVALRYLIMPLAGFVVARVLSLPPELAAGVILVGCCPSGTASNVLTYLAKGDTALSITLSSVNTLLAPVLTPYIFLALAGALIPVRAEDLLADILRIVLLPVSVGLVLRVLFAGTVERLRMIVPLLSVVTIVFIIAIVIALNAAKLFTVAWIALTAVTLHNGAGLAAGFNAARSAGLGASKARALAFTIGVENSGLAAALAMAHLDPLAAVPGALFSVWQNLTGSVLAGYWGNAGFGTKDGE
ncbi:bile acid:sodium symporter family protein [Heliobacterium undosum]|uniref:Bile acid:sodium symporter family protein n=1 Tax=Heliomicrobium undosum TaxID=121734 RepID=A0A845L712_9FIRM|nr:bile acid:sodium symporter family protein [Heliomicrobium undosum]MZP30450.1 bile acid:sodium symporter family protein [Heliomicrobium undosum]